MDQRTRVQVHLPRKSEATIEPELAEDIVIQPRFYKRTGWVPVFYFTVIDVKGKEERYVMTMSAATKQMRIEHLVEVVPLCETEKESTDDSTTDDTSTQDQDVYGTTHSSS